jgi:adenylyl-sulfate kinase
MSDVYFHQRGFILWFTGLSGAGKTTLALGIRPFIARELPTEILDGDAVRTCLSNDLSFSKEDRDRNVGRLGFVARLLGRNGVAVIVAAISPYRAARDEVRKLAEADGVPFIEVYVEAELAPLIAQDVKGFYAKALKGEVPNFTGISQPYEPPNHPDAVVRSHSQTPDACLEEIKRVLHERGLIGISEVAPSLRVLR